MIRSVKLAMALATASTVAVGLAPAQAAVHRPLPGVSNCGTDKPRVRRQNFTVYCGDGSAVAHHLRWTALTARTGKAVGVLIEVVCVPNCAQGHEESFPVKAGFRNVHQVHGRPAFRLMDVAYTKRLPAGHRRHETFVID